MVKYALARGGVFWTLNGEASHVGVPMAFVRFAGCSIGCLQCDTDYAVSERVSLDELLERIERIVPSEYKRIKPWVWLTGGEPTDQNIQPLINQLTAYRVALAESGSHQRDYAGLSWRSVSPHRRLDQVRGSEIKLVPNLGELSWDDVEQSRSWARNCSARYIQPLADNKQEMDRAIEFVRSHVGFYLSAQVHKLWRIP